MNQMWTSPGTEPLIDRLRRAVIGRYDVYAELGQGGMATVFLALDLALDRKVAIKVMSPSLANSADNVERFKREAKVAAALNHPHIIGILAVGDDPELAYFVMKFVEGRALDSVIRDEGPQSVPFVQSVISSAGKALHYAHTRGVIHRDVKPANFMLDQDGWLVVTDFGIAKQGDVKGLTVTGSLIGTPYYMSPEQFHGRPVSPAADQYALGIVAYELLTGRQPYTGDTVAEVMRGHLFDDVPTVRQARPDVPAVIDACVARMMAKEPEARFATLEEAVLAFGAISPTQEQAVRTQIIELARIGAVQQPQIKVPLSPVPVARTRPGAGTPAPAPPLSQTPVPASSESSAPARSRMPLVVGALLVVGAVGGALALKPDLLGRGTAVVEPPTPVLLDSAGRADSIERAKAFVMADSIVHAESKARADSIVRAESLSVAKARTDSVARVDSIARAATAARQAAAQAAARRTAPRPAPTAPARAQKDGRRTPVPPRDPG